MNRKWVWLILVLVAAMALWWYSRRSDLNVDPHAREEIEKAKQR